MLCMSEISETVGEAVEKARESRLHSIVAVLVAVSATFLSICNVKGGNVVQGMAKAQVASNNAWSYFQSKSTKETIAEGIANQLAIQRDATPSITAEARKVLDDKITFYLGEVKRYDKEKGEIKAKAEGFEKEYDRLSVKDDQFDIAEACLTVGIALFGITALTQKRWLLGLALAFAGFGVTVGLAGFVGWDVRPEWIAKLLG